MSTKTYITTLLKKYQQKLPASSPYKDLAQYPFTDWLDNPIAFYALSNLWDDLFKTAAGKYCNDYQAYKEFEWNEQIREGMEYFTYSIKHKRLERIINITTVSEQHPVTEGGRFYILKSVRGSEECNDAFELSIYTDLAPERLMCFFEILRYFTHNLPNSWAEVDDMEIYLAKQYGYYLGFSIPEGNSYNSPLFTQDRHYYWYDLTSEECNLENFKDFFEYECLASDLNQEQYESCEVTLIYDENDPYIAHTRLMVKHQNCLYYDGKIDKTITLHLPLAKKHPQGYLIDNIFMILSEPKLVKQCYQTQSEYNQQIKEEPLPPMDNTLNYAMYANCRAAGKQYFQTDDPVTLHLLTYDDVYGHKSLVVETPSRPYQKVPIKKVFR